MQTVWCSLIVLLFSGGIHSQRKSDDNNSEKDHEINRLQQSLNGRSQQLIHVQNQVTYTCVPTPIYQHNMFTWVHVSICSTEPMFVSIFIRKCLYLFDTQIEDMEKYLNKEREAFQVEVESRNQRILELSRSWEREKEISASMMQQKLDTIRYVLWSFSGSHKYVQTIGSEERRAGTTWGRWNHPICHDEQLFII